MTQLKRSEFQAKIQEGQFGSESQVYLFFGERFLCKEAADSLQDTLLRQQPGAVHTIDGDREDPGQTLARLMSFSLLPGRQIYRIADSRIFHSKTVVAEIWTKAVQAFQAGRPGPASRHLQAMIQAADLKIDGPSPLSEIPPQEWKKVFAFDKPADSLTWADNLLGELPEIPAGNTANLADRYIEAFDKGLPGGNILVLTAETVDKRQRLFTHIKKKGTIIDCSVASGASAAAQNEQKAVLQEMMDKTLAQFGRRIDPPAADLFLERVGFHPVAVVTEIEKMAHFVGDRPVITRNDVELMIARNREDALYELTDAFSKRQVARTLVILSRLLEQGFHSLAILATMRNFLKKQLIFRSLQLRPSPVWRRGMNAKEFQNRYLPDLKAQGEWSELLQGHPYALFMSFSKASDYSCSGLKRWMIMLLDAEFRLKGSPVPPHLVLEELFLAMLQGSPKFSR
ncbi:DNA polymerase III subunit delta [Desulfopila sp. IMCC35006]|uniref:DNA polymerase III subunit delta n=1 Tax=Desulfopila sp. IMCC35006 TaxID=2569542 RepID=UPI0010AC6032|nr:DNA polymerase III subunit delta [Desulfopila sp. IMCC35006]TKB24442.1 DNA polymerase III subunit delta [Desulfopila sp. IMCC35006]